jgi:hypothetical protein
MMDQEQTDLRKETARYIAELANELEQMAARAGLHSIAEQLGQVRDAANAAILATE